jgi:hypothetical protein
VSYTAAHERYGLLREASALLHLAVPRAPKAADDDPWGMRLVKTASPSRVQVRTDAFQRASHPDITLDPDGARRLSIRDGALLIESAGTEPLDRL